MVFIFILTNRIQKSEVGLRNILYSLFILVFTNRIQNSGGGFEKYSVALLSENEKEKLKPKQKHPTKYRSNFWSTRPGGAVLSPSGGEGEVFMKIG
jgi:hypothetical protein